MKLLMKLFLLIAGLTALGTSALADNGCPQGSFSIVNTPDGSTLTILFDEFSLSSGGNTGKSTEQKECNLQIPLHLPEGFSLGVYRVDYRGFARLAPKQSSELTVDYSFMSD